MGEARDRQRPIKVYVTPVERAEIAERARATSLTASTYLRNVGLGHFPKSTLDARLVWDLAKINADQGRLGGLLKLWLAERPGDGAAAFDVRHLLRDVEDAQRQLKALVGRL
jgi:hypothetical protein